MRILIKKNFQIAEPNIFFCEFWVQNDALWAYDDICDSYAYMSFAAIYVCKNIFFGTVTLVVTM